MLWKQDWEVNNTPKKESEKVRRIKRSRIKRLHSDTISEIAMEVRHETQHIDENDPCINQEKSDKALFSAQALTYTDTHIYIG